MATADAAPCHYDARLMLLRITSSRCHYRRISPRQKKKLADSRAYFRFSDADIEFTAGAAPPLSLSSRFEHFDIEA